MTKLARDEILAGTATWEIQAYPLSEEYATEQEARERAVELLTEGRDSVCIVHWRHENNLPRALPAVRSFSCGMDQLRLDTRDRLLVKAVDIFGGAF